MNEQELVIYKQLCIADFKSLNSSFHSFFSQQEKHELQPHRVLFQWRRRILNIILNISNFYHKDFLLLPSSCIFLSPFFILLQLSQFRGSFKAIITLSISTISCVQTCSLKVRFLVPRMTYGTRNLGKRKCNLCVNKLSTRTLVLKLTMLSLT